MISVVPVATASYDSMVRAAACGLLFQMKNRQQPIRGQRAEEQAFAAPAVVNELAAHGAVHAFRRVAELANRELRSILAIAIGQDAVGGSRAHSD